MLGICIIAVYAQVPTKPARKTTQVYQEPVCRRHYSGLFSLPLCLRVVVLVGSIVLAFLLAFATGGFWRKASWEMEQPTVHYSGDGIAVFEVCLFVCVVGGCPLPGLFQACGMPHVQKTRAAAVLRSIKPCRPGLSSP